MNGYVPGNELKKAPKVLSLVKAYRVIAINEMIKVLFFLIATRRENQYDIARSLEETKNEDFKLFDSAWIMKELKR